MTGLCHVSSEAISAAAEWLALTPRDRIDRPVVPALRNRFGLSIEDAIAAIREANRIREADYATTS